MNGGTPRSYNCKDEELPVVCGFSAINITRDLTDFTGFSPVFDVTYVDNYKAKIDAALELVQPKSETVEHKLITERTYATLDGLISPINYLEGYIELAGKKVPISSSDFGLVQLRKSARDRDVENALTQLRTVGLNITKYKPALMEKGLTEALITKFTDASVAIAADKKQSYTLISTRSAIVQNNLGQLNDLNAQLCEICRIGKILYKQTDKAKLNDYTFTYLMKQVRRTEKPELVKPVVEKPTEPPAAEASE